MFTVLSALVALGCVLASARRLAGVVSVTWLDPKLLLRELRCGDAERAAALRGAAADCPGAVWERAILEALATPDARARASLVHEQLRELDWNAQRWARAPRVCASVASSAGFLFGCAALMRALDDPEACGGVAGLVPALNAVAVGIAAACFCMAAHARSRRIIRSRLADADRLVECLEAEAPRDAPAGDAPGEPHGEPQPKRAPVWNT